MLTAGGVDPAPASTGHAISSLVVAVLAVAGVLLAERLTRQRLLRRALIAAARYDAEMGATLADPSAAALVGYGSELGELPHEGEADAAYALRVWGVHRVAE